MDQSGSGDNGFGAARTSPVAGLMPGGRSTRAGGGNGPGKREVDLYVRTYTTLLQSSGAIGVSSLEPAHLTAASSLHAGAAEQAPDMNAFMYSTQRLPACIVDVRQIVLGQSARAFERAGFEGMDEWAAVKAPGRRRRWHYDGAEVLAAYIASCVGPGRPDPDDRGLSDRVEQV